MWVKEQEPHCLDSTDHGPLLYQCQNNRWILQWVLFCWLNLVICQHWNTEKIVSCHLQCVCVTNNWTDDSMYLFVTYFVFVCHFVSDFFSSPRFIDVENLGKLECFDAVAPSLSTSLSHTVTHVPGCLFYLLALLFSYSVIARPARVHACTLITICMLLTYSTIREYLMLGGYSSHSHF